ncbi:MAG: PQQ-dependent sugar dehydrogenase [Pseudomonadota bacterium]
MGPWVLINEGWCYTGDKFPNWKGALFVGALAHLHLRRLKLDGDKVVDQEILLQDLSERIRDVRMGPDGYLYILTDSRNGSLLRLKNIDN